MFISTYNLPAKPQQCLGWHQSCCSYLIDCCSWASNEMDGGVISDIRSRQLCLNTASQYLAWMSTEYGLRKAWCPACDWLQMRHWRQAVVTRPRTKTKQMLKCSPLAAVAALVLCYHWVWQFDSFVIQCPWFCGHSLYCQGLGRGGLERWWARHSCERWAQHTLHPKIEA